MKASCYALLAALSFEVLGNIIQANPGFFGWWNIPALIFGLAGFYLMDAYAKRYRG